MSSNDPPNPAKPGGESRSRRENEPNETPLDDSGSASAPRGGSREPKSPAGKADFGSLTRSSADLFKMPGRSPRGTPEQPASSERIPAQSPRERVQDDASSSRGRTAPQRSRRYWRDSVTGAGTSSVAGERRDGQSPSGEEHPVRRRAVWMGGDGGGGSFGGLLSGGGMSRNLLGLLLGGLLALLVIIFLVNQLGDDNDEPVTEPTSENVLVPGVPGAGTDVPATATPGSGTEPTDAPSEPTEPATGEPQRGGDNQRSQDEADGTRTPEGNLNPTDRDLALASTPVGDGTGAPAQARDSANQDVAMASPPAGDGTGAPASLAEAQPGPVANSCPATCLVRVPGSADLDTILTTAGTRPSFAADNWTWVAASTQGIAFIEAKAATVLVAPQVNTLNAYVVRVPEGQTDNSAIEAFGTIVDSVDRYRVVEVAKVPARVSSLTGAGFEVFKMAPAPAGVTTDASERTPLSSIDIGELLDDVDPANLETTIRELQATSSNDGSGVGSRYYSLTGNAMASEYLFQRMEALGMKVWYEDFIGPDGLLLVNVVGELPGADPSAIYGLMAHFDTISTDTGNAPGADDNATGIAASLEIARILSGYDLKHPVRLVFVNAEEVGIIGADVWARKIVADAVPIEGVFNLDSIGSDRQGTLIYLNSGPQSAWMQELMVEVNSAYGLGQELATRQNPRIVADDNKVRDQGIEAVLVARELYGMSPVHHTPDDLIEAVSIENTMSATQLILLSVASLVQ